jgi:hypothetical protein
MDYRIACFDLFLDPIWSRMDCAKAALTPRIWLEAQRRSLKDRSSYSSICSTGVSGFQPAPGLADGLVRDPPVNRRGDCLYVSAKNAPAIIAEHPDPGPPH